MVAPDLRGRGLGRLLLEHAERAAPPGVTTYQLFTREHNVRLYKKAGYSLRGHKDQDIDVLVMTKPRRRR
jgi:tRNA (guanine37-N1)-methyltransferase